MFTFAVTIKSGSGLVAKDIGGKSDPYVKFGLVTASGDFFEDPEQTSTIYKTLDPEWKTENSAVLFEPSGKAVGVRFEVWDEDKIGKDEFMGQKTVRFGAEIVEDDDTSRTQKPLTLTLESRPDKKDKVSGTLSITYSYLTKAKEKVLIAQKEEEEAQAHAAKVEELLKDLPTISKSTDAAKLREIGKKVLERGSGPITDKTVLRAILRDVGLWDAVTRFSFWANDFGTGNKNVFADDEVSRRALESDVGYQQAQMEKAWAVFDHDDNGKIELRELLIGVTVIASDVSVVDRASFFFEVFDTDKNGQLDPRELLSLFQSDWRQNVAICTSAIAAKLGARISEFRQDSLKNIIQKLRLKLYNDNYPAKLVSALLLHADLDKSGTISKDEYVSFAKTKSARVQVQEAIFRIMKSLQSEVEPDVLAAIKELGLA